MDPPSRLREEKEAEGKNLRYYFRSRDQEQLFEEEYAEGSGAIKTKGESVRSCYLKGKKKKKKKRERTIGREVGVAKEEELSSDNKERRSSSMISPYEEGESWEGQEEEGEGAAEREDREERDEEEEEN